LYDVKPLDKPLRHIKIDKEKVRLKKLNVESD